MTYKELLKRIATYDGDWNDEVYFVDYKNDPTTDEQGHNVYRITSLGISKGKCLLNNVYD